MVLIWVDSLQRIIRETDSLLTDARARVDVLSGIAQRVAEPWYETGLAQVLLGGVLAVVGGFGAQLLRDRLETRRLKNQLIRRMRWALENAAITARSILRHKDKTKEINAESLNGLILEWHRYDRVSDNIGLLKAPRIVEDVENALGFTRMVAEAILENERRIKSTAAYLGERDPTGINLDPSIIKQIEDKRQEYLDQIEIMGKQAQRVLDAFNQRWKSPVWHEPRRDSEGEKATPSPPTPEGNMPPSTSRG
jgi:hypothetical protein